MSSKYRQRVTLPSGNEVWCCGQTIPDLIAIAIKKTLEASKEEKQATIPDFFTYAEHWYDTYHKPKVKYNTALNTRTYLNKYIYPHIKTLPINKVTFDNVQAIFSAMVNKAASTVDKVKITLNKIFENAKEDGYVNKNIMDSDRYVLSTKKVKRCALTMPEVKDIINHLPDLLPNDRLMIGLALYTGMRRGEILGLRWEDVDLEKDFIHVKRGIVFIDNRPMLSEPKSKAGIRDIPIDPALNKILQEQKDRSGFLIKNAKNPSIPLTETGFQRMFERISKTIDLHGATMHVFRHTYATIRQTQTDVKTLQYIMGHSDVKVTMNTYADAINENVQKLSEISLF